MPPRGRGRGRGRHDGGRGRQVWVRRDRLAGDETSQARATTGEHIVPNAPAQHAPHRDQPSRGGAGRGFRARGGTGPPPSRHGAGHVRYRDNVALPPSAQPAVDATLNESPVAATCSPILVREPPDWYFTFYIRTDLQGSFHTYPRLDGPFKSLQEADDAIDRHLLSRTDPKMSKESLDKLSIREVAVRKALYFPDGTRRKDLEPLDETLDEIYLLVHALVDQYNDDHNLLEDRALQLKDVQREHFFFSRRDLYYHFNFTAGTKGLVDSYFAEVKCIRQGEHEEMVASCFFIIKHNDNGRCYGCQNNGAVDMKHPNKADAYCRGHMDEYMSCVGGYHMEQRFESLEDEEERLRYQFKCFDDPRFMAEHFPNCRKTMVKT
uniref:Uncharacterized protein n=1 Tax=Avena sativa TaxID=4498 RepID=A0ACD6A4L4_AVESA